MNSWTEASFLSKIGEWAALGFYEGDSLAWPRPYGLAYRRLYENMQVRVEPGRLLIPSEPFPRCRTMESHGVWTAQAYILDFDHNRGLRVNRDIAKEKAERFPHYAEGIDALAADFERRLRYFGGYTHCNPDMRRVVGEGFLAMERELDEQIAEVNRLRAEADSQELEGEQNLLAALKDYAAGVRAFHARALGAIREAVREADGERRDELEKVALAFERAFLHPADSFLSGLLAVHFTWLLDGCDSIGRLDQALGALYECDIAKGEIDVALARRLLDELWGNFERFNAWNLQIGGRTPDGRDGTNALTRECILACGRNAFRRPNVALRLTAETPEDVLTEALCVLSHGSGRPALYNDDLYIATLHGMDLGLTLEDAREIGFGGCTETMIGGMSNVGSLEGEIHLAKALELALRDGFDPIEKRQAGPHTGRFEDFGDFDAFLDAVRRQIQFATDAFVAWANRELPKRYTDGDPMLCRTFFTRDCVRNRKAFDAGGARYNWSVVSYQGIANLIDSLAAIRKVLYDERATTSRELIEALDADFEGYENLRRRLEAAPKFGNDDDYVDRLGSDLIRYAWSELYSHTPPRGGRYLASCILFITYGMAGQRVGATPDGRRAAKPLTDSVGPAQGRDTRGPTAMLRSVAKLPLHLAVGTPVLNMRIQKALLETPDSMHATAALIRSFFAQGGMQVQLSVLSREAMLAAQAEPEKHADLIVRIGGYSEYFTKLDRALQDSVIARTEHAWDAAPS